MAGYGTGTSRLGGVRGAAPGTPAYPADPHEAAWLNIRYVDEAVVDVSDYDSLKLIKTVGGLDSFTFNAAAIEWVEDDLYRREDTVTAAVVTTDDHLHVTGKAHRYPVGTVLEMVDDAVYGAGSYARELILVTAQASADQLTVVRGFGPTTAMATGYASGAPFRVAGFAHAEGQAWTAQQTSLKAIICYNVPSIIAGSIKSTFANEGINRYGTPLGGDFDEQLGKALKVKVLSLEQGLLLGQRNVGTGTADPSMMGGILYYVDSSYDTKVTETDKSGAAITLKDINDTVTAIAKLVGVDNVSKTLWTGPWGLRKVNSFFEPSVRYQRTENKMGLMVQTIDTVVGPVEIVMDVNMPEGMWLFLNPPAVSMGHAEGLGKLHTGDTGYLPGDYFEKFFYGQYSCKVKNPVTMAKVINFSTTA